ncbi:hypothetical protein MPER_01746, partial [Moniliophthora perniciosa FA553]
ITKISFPQTTNAGRAQKLAYVEFTNEESMQAGLSSHAEKLNDAVPDVKQATDKETRDRERDHKEGGGFTPNPAFNSGSVRGRGRGRGGGGGYAQRGLAMAGLTGGGGRGRGGSTSGSDVQGAVPSA